MRKRLCSKRNIVFSDVTEESKVYCDDEDSEDDGFDPNFKSGFLDDYYNIRKDVIEKLKK